MCVSEPGSLWCNVWLMFITITHLKIKVSIRKAFMESRRQILSCAHNDTARKKRDNKKKNVEVRDKQINFEQYKYTLHYTKAVFI